MVEFSVILSVYVTVTCPFTSVVAVVLLKVPFPESLENVTGIFAGLAPSAFVTVAVTTDELIDGLFEASTIVGSWVYVLFAVSIG
ncbi:hypothetical protein CLSAB_10450 [Clostridium saccharobutylicum]|uniref:S-layer domain-containing protein n=1 Tax=Clostridium saccharobutylicum DSM 13864 TaxID=1345695 RepID=U5MYA2_CLOSA|nr:S-layer domain-containing protein [Clostridium saccharobutylicum DSM 13864]OOM18109.1 hypothetical protein CLSAB_10450 [Clostridium saccharobutylicum]